MCEISRKSSYLAYYGPSLSVPGTVCALHSNVLIYSLLKLNAAVNAASDSITLCPRSIADEACAPLIKLRRAMETAQKKNCVTEKADGGSHHGVHIYPISLVATEELILRENSPIFQMPLLFHLFIYFSESILTF